jgi:hypothetical protein
MIKKKKLRTVSVVFQKNKIKKGHLKVSFSAVVTDFIHKV